MRPPGEVEDGSGSMSGEIIRSLKGSTAMILLSEIGD